MAALPCVLLGSNGLSYVQVAFASALSSAWPVVLAGLLPEDFLIKTLLEALLWGGRYGGTPSRLNSLFA